MQPVSDNFECKYRYAMKAAEKSRAAREKKERANIRERKQKQKNGLTISGMLKMLSTIIFVLVTILCSAYLAIVVCMGPKLAVNSIAATIVQLALLLTCVLMNAMRMGNVNTATGICQAIMLIIGLVLLIESALRLSKLLKLTTSQSTTQSKT